mgnify:FL=1
MASIGEVARRAQVSVATVSRVLNHSDKVREETREAVMRAIDELHYTPNMLGIGLRRCASGVVIVSMTTMSNLLYATMVEGVNACAAQHGYRVLLSVTDGDPAREREAYEMARLKLAEGVLALTTVIDGDTLNRYAAEIPIVRCCRHPLEAQVAAVLTDDREGAYEAVCRLRELGRRRIACMTIASELEVVGSDREEGYRRAMQEGGLPVPEGYVVYSGYAFSAGLEESRRLLEAHPKVDAVFCATDIMAFNTIKVLHSLGRRVPEDVCVIGYDNSPYALLSSPPMTSVDQDSFRIGYRAMERLLAKMAGEDDTADTRFVPHCLVERASTAV